MGEHPSPPTRIGEPENDPERRAAWASFRQDDPDDAAQNAPVGPSGPFDYEPDTLMAAWHGSQPGVVAGYRVARDGTAFVWPPIDAARTPARGAAVMSSLIERLESTRYHTALAVIEPDRQDQRRLLEQAGFTATGGFAAMRHPLTPGTAGSAGPRRTGADDRFLWTRYDSSNKARFESLADRCLVSVDGPARRSPPTGGELLASFAASEDFSPWNWWLIGRAGREVAVILVNGNEHAREIVFLGVVPEARHQGIGTLALEFVLKNAAHDRCESVDVFVEVDNHAAMSLYTGAGFLVTATRLGFVRCRVD